MRRGSKHIFDQRREKNCGARHCIIARGENKAQGWPRLTTIKSKNTCIGKGRGALFCADVLEKKTEKRSREGK